MPRGAEFLNEVCGTFKDFGSISSSKIRRGQPLNFPHSQRHVIYYVKSASSRLSGWLGWMTFGINESRHEFYQIYRVRSSRAVVSSQVRTIVSVFFNSSLGVNKLRLKARF